MEYDVITGISAGAINAFGLSLFAKGQEWEASDFMLDFWQDLTQGDVFKAWDTSYYDALFRQRGLVNNTHFYNYIDKKLPKDSKIKRAISVGTFDINNGVFKRFDESLPFP